MMMFLISSALGGILMPSAFSTLRMEAMAWTVVHTPQNLCTKYHASRGSRPWRIFSMPRNMVLLLQASATPFPLTSASIRRCPSILVMGSMTIFAMGYSSFFPSVSLFFLRALMTPWPAKAAAVAMASPAPI